MALKDKAVQFYIDMGNEPEYAERLATAAEHGALAGLQFQWSHDDITSEDFTDEGPFYRLWVVIVRDCSGNVVGSLGAVDFGPDGEPWGDPYARLVEAELAVEYFEDTGWCKE